LDLRRCAICGRFFSPEPRARLQQKCCSKKCSKKLKRRRNRQHKQLYRQTGLGKEQRRRENETQRDRLGWNDYMRFWRKATPEIRARQERERARRYYQAHRDQILAKRRQRRAAKRNAQNPPLGAWSH